MKCRLGEGALIAAAAVTGIAAFALTPALAPVVVRAPRATVSVTIKDFKVKAGRSTAQAGTIVLRIQNAGPSTHEFNVDRTDHDAAALPLKSDGLTVDEDAAGLHRIGSIEEINLGETANLRVKLPPGHYVFYCNLEGHYLGGMHWSLNVTSDAQ
jgi:uncharacterized cupredoxin-like copper-binding protein